MKPILAILSFSFSLAAAAEPVVLENRALRVEIAPDRGSISVREKSSGQVWSQPAAEKKSAPAYRILKQTKTSLPR